MLIFHPGCKARHGIRRRARQGLCRHRLVWNTHALHQRIKHGMISRNCPAPGPARPRKASRPSATPPSLCRQADGRMNAPLQALNGAVGMVVRVR